MVNAEVKRRLHKHNEHTDVFDRDVLITDNDDGNTPVVSDASDSESEEDEAPTMRKHIPRRLGRLQHTRSACGDLQE